MNKIIIIAAFVLVVISCMASMPVYYYSPSFTFSYTSFLDPSYVFWYPARFSIKSRTELVTYVPSQVNTYILQSYDNYNYYYKPNSRVTHFGYPFLFATTPIMGYYMDPYPTSGYYYYPLGW